MMFVAVAQLSLLTSLCQTEGSENSAPSADQVIHRLTSLRHGISWLDAETQALLDHVLAHPDHYAEAIAAALTLPDERSLGAQVTVHRMSRAAYLARLMGPEHTRTALHQLFDEAAARLSRYRVDRGRNSATSQPSDAPMQAVFTLRNVAIDTLGAWRDPYAVDRALETAKAAGMADRTIMLRYVGQVAETDSALEQRLVRLEPIPKHT